MDPQVCWDEICASLADLYINPTDPNSTARQDAIDSLRHLADWLDNEGLPPRVNVIFNGS